MILLAIVICVKTVPIFVDAQASITLPAFQVGEACTAW